MDDWVVDGRREGRVGVGVGREVRVEMEHAKQRIYSVCRGSLVCKQTRE